MELRSPYFRNLFIPYVILLGTGIVGLGLFAARLLREACLEDTQAALQDQARLVEALVEKDLRDGTGGALGPRLRSYETAIRCRITIVDEAGRVLGDSEADPALMDNHRGRPEITAAAAQGDGYHVRRSETVGVEMMYWATRFGGAAGPPLHYVRLAVPLGRLDERLQTLRAALVPASAVALLLGGLVCFLFARRQANAIVDLTRLAEAIARGDLQRRIQADGTGELGVLARSLNAMAESLARAAAQATRSRNERGAILSGMSEGLIATDGHLRVRYGNPAAAALLDYPPAPVEGTSLDALVRDDRFLKTAQEALASGERKTLPDVTVRDRHVAVSFAPLPALEGGGEGLVIVVHDVSQSMKYEGLRKEFVANVSHELRTPLTAIQGYVETLQDGAIRDPERALAFLATIDKHSRQLANLVDDLLQISRLEGRADLPRRVPMDVERVVRNALDLLGPAAQRKRLALTVDLPEGLPAVAGDPDTLERAVANLVDNAVKYTPEGGSIRVAVARRGERIVVEVTDTGIGIPAEALPRVFERFYRVDKSRSREMGGTGLGLSIVKHVVQAHGGSVEAESEPGKGSVFRIVLPTLSGAGSG